MVTWKGKNITVTSLTHFNLFIQFVGICEITVLPLGLGSRWLHFDLKWFWEIELRLCIQLVDTNS